VEKLAAEFKMGRESIGDDERPGRPKEATNDETVEAVNDQKARPGLIFQDIFCLATRIT
jgi:hypothetical protein